MRKVSGYSGIARFVSHEGGNFTLVFAAALTSLMMSAGFAANYAQLSLIRSNLLATVDGAVTSTARDITTGKIDLDQAGEMVRVFIDANGGSAFVDTDAIRLDDLEINRIANTVSAKVSIDVDILFPFFGNANTTEVAVESKAVYSDKDIEVAMMLDITGSMRGRKLHDLQSAAKIAAYAFVGGQDIDNPRVRVAIIPYANAVNVGSLAPVVVYNETGFTTGEPPATDDPVLAGIGTDDCATERKGSRQFTDDGPDLAKVNRDYRLDFCPEPELMPLTADYDQLEATIDSFRADGYTAGHIGIQWSWYMLSHEWADYLPASAEPAKRNDPKVAKYAILMTDGEFNTAFADVPRGEATAGRQAFRSRNKAERLCMEMKKDGIEVFTVGFDLDSANARGVLRKCASKDYGSVQHYFEAGDGADLEAAFLEIAANIERLALVK